MLNCQIEYRITKYDERSFADLMAKKMFENELMGKRIFHNNFKRLNAFISLAVSYAAKHAKLITCRNDYGKIVACAIIYDRPTDKNLTIGSVIKDNGFFNSLGKIFSAGIGNVNRLNKMEKKYHVFEIKEPHIYIQMLASNEKGMGHKLMEFIKKQYSSRKLYLESSVAKNDHAYYRNCGFIELARLETFGFEQVLFVRDITT